MGLKLSNNATTTLAAPLTAAATSLQVINGGLFPALSSGDWFPITVVDAAANREIMRVTARSGNLFTIDRAEEGTSALEFAAGDRVDLRLTSGALLTAFADQQAAFNAALAAQQTAFNAAIALKANGNSIMRAFYANATWVKPAGLKGLWVLVLGAGGGGGGTTPTGAGQYVTGGGGGAGGWCLHEYTTAQIASIGNIGVQVGTGGIGAAGSNGFTGNRSVFGTLIANGGSGGTYTPPVTSGPYGAGAGSGGTASGGSVNFIGQNGGLGTSLFTSVFCMRGGGGTGPFGNAPVEYLTQNANGEPGLGFGVGGAGAVSSNGAGARAGGNGAPGFVLVIERY